MSEPKIEDWSVTPEEYERMKRTWSDMALDEDIQRVIESSPSKRSTQSELTPIRVGYILFSTFNGRLIFVADERSNEIIVSIATDETLIKSNETKLTDISGIFKLLTRFRTEFGKPVFKVSDYIMSTVNETFVITQLMPSQPLGIYTPVIHPALTYECALRALFACFVCWPTRKLDLKDRWWIAEVLLPKADKEIFLRMIKDPLKCSLIEVIQDVNQSYSGDMINRMKHIFSRMSPTELTILSMNINSMEYNAFCNVLSEGMEEPPGLKPTSSSMIYNLQKTIASIEYIDETRDERRFKLEERKKRLSCMFVSKYDFKKYSLEHLQKVASEILITCIEFRDYMSVDMKSIIEKEHKIIGKWLDKDGSTKPIFIHEGDPAMMRGMAGDYARQRELDHKYDSFYKFVVRTHKIGMRAIDRAIGRFDQDDEDKIGRIVEEFFKSRHLSKKVATTTGGVRGLKSLSALSSFLYTVIPFTVSDDSLAIEDKNILGQLRSRLNKLTADRSSLPVQAVIGLIKQDMRTLLSILPTHVTPVIESRLSQLYLSSNYNQAWSNLTRLKGEVYEPLFAERWGLTYLTEDQKPTLLTVLRQTLPSYVNLFINRTTNHPEIREFKPDFVLVKVPPLTTNWYGVVDADPETIPIMKKTASPASIASTKLTMESAETGSRIFVQRKELRQHPMGNDDYILRPVHYISSFLKNLVDFANRRGAKGGIIMEDNEQQALIIETVVQAVGQNEEPKEVGVTARISKEEQTVPKEDILEETKMDSAVDEESEMIRLDSSTKLVQTKPWSTVEYTPDFDHPEILLIEVGYQTDQERKITSDLRKWNHAVEILRSLKIKTTVLSAVDTTRAPNDCWWIDQTAIPIIRRSLAKAFKLLDQNSPMDVTEMIISDISTQKIRANLRTGSIIRPPVLASDVIDYYAKWRNTFINRPSGATLPSRIESDLIQSLIFGATLKTDKDIINDMLDNLIDRSEEIVKLVCSTKRFMEATEPDKTCYEFIIGWLLEDLEMAYCSDCFKDKVNQCKQVKKENQVLKLANELAIANYCEKCSQNKELPSDRSSYVDDLLTVRTSGFKFMTNIKTFNSIEEDSDEPFDKFVRMVVPSKSQKQKRMKSLKKRVSERIIQLNGECGFKDSKGQIFISRYYEQIQKNLAISDDKEFNKTRIREELAKSVVKRGRIDFTPVLDTIEEEKEASEMKLELEAIQANAYESLNKKKRRIMRELNQDFKSLIKLATGELGDGQLDIIKQMSKNPLFLSKLPKCVLKKSWIDEILNALNIEKDSKDFIRKIKEKYAKMSKHNESDDRMPIIQRGEVYSYLTRKEKEVTWTDSLNNLFSWSCVLFEELLNETINRLKGTVYQSTPFFIKQCLTLLLKFDWFQRVTFYSKICQIFLVCCSEFNHSGIKVKKISHTNLNLVVKIPEKKSTNMLCSIRTSDMLETDRKCFFLNRRNAIFGQSLPYCYLVCFVQLVQTYNCTGALSGNLNLIKETYDEILPMQFNNMKQCLILVKMGSFDDAIEISMRNQDRFSAVHSTQSEVLSNVLVGFNISMGILLGPSIALNSPIFNKQLQTIRYPYMLALSEFGMPKLMGGKMSAPRRRIESEVARLYLQLCSFASLLNPTANIAGWKKDQFRPITTIQSLSIYGSRILCDRHFVFDIYLVHLYNKEIDDFEENQIKVFADYAERHVSWEKELSSAIALYNKKGASTKERELCQQRMRLLLGIPRLETKKYKRDCIKILNSSLRGDKIRRYSITTSKGDSSSTNSDTSEQSSLTIKTSKTRSSSSLLFRTRSMKSYTIPLPQSLQIESSEETDFQEIVKPVIHEVEYSPRFDKLFMDIKSIINHCPKHSYASYELCQLAAEVSKYDFNEGAMERARRSEKNWRPITSVIETTSIIARPITQIGMVDSISCISRNISKKLMKLLKQRLDHSKDAGGHKEKESLINYFLESMLDIGGQWSQIAEKVAKVAKDSNKLDYISWEHQVKLPIDKTLMTNDANQIYYWIKSLSKDLKRVRSNKSLKGKFDHKTENTKYIRSVLDNRGYTDSEEVLQKIIDATHEEWAKSTLELAEYLKCPKLTEEILEEMRTEFYELDENYKCLKKQKRNFESANFLTEENLLRNLEEKFLIKHSNNLSIMFNLLLIHVLNCPWYELLETCELLMIQHKGVLRFDDAYMQVSFISLLLRLVTFSKTSHRILGIDQPLATDLSRYLMVMFRIAGLPFRHLYEQYGDELGYSEISLYLVRVKEQLSVSPADEVGYDFFITVYSIRSKNFLSMKRLLSRSGNDRLPRSVRSKVLYELVKSTQETKQAILQQQAFGAILNVNHRNYATLAPKGQLGATRDLLVQERDTKLINATSELFQMAILDNTVTDVLANPKVKDIALSNSNEQKQIAHDKHLSLYGSTKEQDTGMLQFYKVYTISGDHGKWGPIHCCSTFSAISQQLLRNNHDWKNFDMLVNLKSLNKQIEIPSPVIEKIFRSYITSESYAKRAKSQMREADIRSDIKKESEKWAWTGYMPDIIKWYISEGQISMNSYNHMGQGIHHKKSSVLGKCDRDLLCIVCKGYFKKKLPKLNMEIEFAGSSDDFMVIFRITGVISKEESDLYEGEVKKKMLDCLNIWNGLSRCMQMLVSEKTVVSSCVTEMYSDFDMYWRMSPSVIKYNISSIINTTINTPLTLFQSTHVCSQQAAMMSTSYLTNLAFCLSRQQVVLNHVEKVIRQYGEVIFKLPSSFGRLYIPKLSTLLTSSADLEDLELIIAACNLLKEFLDLCSPTLLEDEVRPGTPSKLPEIEDKNWLMTGERPEFKPDKHVELLQDSTYHGFNIYTPINQTATQTPKDLTDTSSTVTSGTNSKSYEDPIEAALKNYNYGKLRDTSTTISDQTSGSSNMIFSAKSDSSSSDSNRKLNESSDDHQSQLSLSKIINDMPNPLSTYDADDYIFYDEGLSTHNHEKQHYSIYESVAQLSNNKAVKLMYSVKNRDITMTDLCKQILLANIVCMIISSYDSFRAEGIERVLKGMAMTNCQTHIEDPFLFMFPDHVRGCLRRLNLLKSEASTPYEEAEALGNNASYIAKSLIESNNATEEFTSELQRIRQIVNSRNIINKLSGGMKEHSLPYIRMCYNSYFFNNKLSMHISDHWGKTKDTSVKSNENKVVEGINKIKFRTWIEEVVKLGLLKLNRDETLIGEFDFLLSPKVCKPIYIHTDESPDKNSQVIRKDDNKSIICKVAYSMEALGKLMIELAGLHSKLNSYNRERILEAELNPLGREIPAKYIIITKTKLFSRDTNLRLGNNPAVVIGFILDPVTAESVRPIGMRLSELETDKQALLSFFPQIGELLSRIKRNELKSSDEVKKACSVLLGFCRKLTSDSLSSTPFYAFRPISSTYDDSSSSIVSYGTIEGTEVLIDESKIYSATFSERYYRIMECISGISALMVAGDKKTRLLKKFLLWDPHSTSHDVKIEGIEKTCPDTRDEKEAIDLFKSNCIAVQLVGEAQATKSQKHKEEILNIAYLVINESNIGTESRRTDLKLVFRTEGNIFADGRFQMSCEYGSAVGIFLDRKLIITMSQKDTNLFITMENRIIKWCYGIEPILLTKEWHLKFMDLLPRYSDCYKLNRVPDACTVDLYIENDVCGITLNKLDPNSNAIFIKPDLLTMRSHHPERVSISPKLKWSTGRLSIYISDETIDITTSSYIPLVNDSLVTLKVNEPLSTTASTLKQKDVLLSTIDLPKTISYTSFLLFHRFLYHKVERPTNMDLSTKRIFETFDIQGYPDSLRQMILEDKTLDIIKEYALGKSASEKEHDKRIMEIIKKTDTISCVFEDETYELCNGELFKIDENVRIKLDESAVNYDKIIKKLEGERLSAFNESLDLPTQLQAEVHKEFESVLLQRDKEQRIKEVAVLMNRTFKDIAAWPFVQMVLDELGFDDVAIGVTRRPHDQSTQWLLTLISGTSGPKPPRDIFTAIDSVRMKQIPIQFAYAVVTHDSVKYFVNKISELNMDISALPISRTHIRAVMSILIYFQYLKIESTKVAYDWIDMLKKSLPFHLDLRNKSSIMTFRIIDGFVVCQLCTSISFKEYNEMQELAKAAKAEFDKARDNRIEEAMRSKNRGSKKIQKYIERLKLATFDSEAEAIKYLTTRLLNCLPFSGIDNLPMITKDVIRLNVPNGYRYCVIFCPNKLLEVVGLLNFVTSTLELDTIKAKLAIGASVLIYKNLFGYKVNEDLQDILMETMDYISEQRSKYEKIDVRKETKSKDAKGKDSLEANLEAKLLLSDLSTVNVLPDVDSESESDSEPETVSPYVDQTVTTYVDNDYELLFSALSVDEPDNIHFG